MALAPSNIPQGSYRSCLASNRCQVTPGSHFTVALLCLLKICKIYNIMSEDIYHVCFAWMEMHFCTDIDLFKHTTDMTASMLKHKHTYSARFSEACLVTSDHVSSLKADSIFSCRGEVICQVIGYVKSKPSETERPLLGNCLKLNHVEGKGNC